MGLDIVTDRGFCQKKKPVGSWDTLGPQFSMKPASDRKKPSCIASARPEFLWQIFFPDSNGEALSEK